MLPSMKNATAWSICALLLCCCMTLVEATSFASRQAMPLHARPFGSRRQRQISNARAYPSQKGQQDIQQCSNVKRPPSQSKNIQRASTATSTKSTTTSVRPSNTNTLLYFIKVGLAGGIAGAVGSAVLYPMDAAKTLRQSSPSLYSSVFHALGSLACTTTTAGGRTWHIQNVYRGIIPACVGAIPSSALYFGAYESMKTVLARHFPMDNQEEDNNNNFSNRLMVHALAAMSGNILSSAIFVPKELIKQQLQYRQSGNVLGVIVDVLKEKGIAGLYVGYKATLLRNIPTAVMRFSLYEEFRYRWYTKDQLRWKKPSSHDQPPKSFFFGTSISPKFFLAGACAGALASGVMTPVDVIKTRMATGTCPVDVKSCFLYVVKDEGLAGLYSGAGSRMFFSGAFSAIGFGTFEFAKGLLGVSSLPPTRKAD